MDSALPPAVPTVRPLGALTTRGVHGLCSLGTAATPTDRTHTTPRSGASGGELWEVGRERAAGKDGRGEKERWEKESSIGATLYLGLNLMAQTCQVLKIASLSACKYELEDAGNHVLFSL